MKKLTLLLGIFIICSTTVSAATVILGTPATQPTSVTSSATPTTSSSQIFTFTRGLILGMTGQDVSALNKILDLEFNTTIANSGTYTTATQSYVSQLQLRYASDILTPNGLTSGTGAVGPATRVKLNALAQEYGLTVADFPAPASPSYSQIFTQTLSLGTVSSQVSLLKTVLNSDSSTQLIYVNSSQLADPANLFDTPTQIAVNKFQQKYAATILVPNGLSAPTGTVGSATRAKLNAVLASITTGATKTIAVASTTYTVPVIGNNTTVNSCTSDTWGDSNNPTGCSDPSWGWGTCQPNGTQTRTCQITSVCSNPGANHNSPYTTSQSCAIGHGTVIATGHIDSCSHGTGDCIVDSGSQYGTACTNNNLSCPPGTNLVKGISSNTGQNTSLCPSYTTPHMVAQCTSWFLFICTGNGWVQNGWDTNNNTQTETSYSCVTK